MARNKNAKIKMETGRNLVAFEQMTDSGDAQTFNPSEAIMSGADGFTPDIRPNGIVTGLNLISVAVSGSNDVVDVAAFSAYSQGTLYSVAASADEAITRPATAVSKINSITMTSAGAIAVVAGTDGSTTAFSETRGAAGGPPFIPVDSVEIGQVRLTSNTAAPITADEIKQNPGNHTELSGFPSWQTNNIGGGTNAASAAEVNAFVKFDDTLPLIHTGSVPKRTYAQYYAPTLTDLPKALDFVPAEKSFSASTSEFYGGSINSSSESLGQASFSVINEDGIKDIIVANKNKVLTFQFFQDRNKAAYILTQGIMSLARTFVVADQPGASVTVTPENESAEFSS